MIQDGNILNKVNFDISAISTNGLIGNNNNLRSVSYEFCVPKNTQIIFEIKKIDSQINFYSSKGRIGCNENQYLVIGDTHKSNWLEILTSMAHLNYVNRIDRFFGE